MKEEMKYLLESYLLMLLLGPVSVFILVFGKGQLKWLAPALVAVTTVLLLVYLFKVRRQYGLRKKLSGSLDYFFICMGALMMFWYMLASSGGFPSAIQYFLKVIAGVSIVSFLVTSTVYMFFVRLEVS